MKSKFAPLFILAIIFSSCKTYLTPALLGNNMGYLPKAMHADSLRSITNFSASYAGASAPDTKVNFELGMANIGRSHTFNKFNISYGAFGYFGTAESYNANATNGFDNLPSFKKSISGLGLRFSTGLHSTSKNGNTDFRYLNFENAISTENGSYLDFRNELHSQSLPSNVAVSNKRVLWTTGLSTEVIWRARKNHDIKHAFRLFIGATPGLRDSFKFGEKVKDEMDKPGSGGWVISYFLYIKKFSLTLEAANHVNLANKISLGYSL